MTNFCIRYNEIKPQSFRVGDIVEVAFSLVAYKMRTGEHVLKPMLYSLVLLDEQFANVSISFSHLQAKI